MAYPDPYTHNPDHLSNKAPASALDEMVAKKYLVPTDAAKPSPLELAVMSLQSALASALASVSRLETQLAPLMGELDTVNTRPEPAHVIPPHTSSKLGQALREITMSLEGNLVRRLDDLAHGLEI